MDGISIGCLWCPTHASQNDWHSEAGSATSAAAYRARIKGTSRHSPRSAVTSKQNKTNKTNHDQNKTKQTMIKTNHHYVMRSIPFSSPVLGKTGGHNLMLPQTSTSMCQVPLSRAHDICVIVLVILIIIVIIIIIIIIIGPECKQWKHEWKHESQSYEFGQRSASATPPRRASSQSSGATYPRP